MGTQVDSSEINFEWHTKEFTLLNECSEDLLKVFEQGGLIDSVLVGALWINGIDKVFFWKIIQYYASWLIGVKGQMRAERSITVGQKWCY